METGQWLNETAAARLLGRPVQTLRQWRYLKRGPSYYRNGGRILYYEPDVIEFILGSRVDPEVARMEAAQ
jgi:hypothetical protein